MGAIVLPSNGNELDKLIDSYGIGWYQIVVLLMCGACVIADGAEMLGEWTAGRVVAARTSLSFSAPPRGAPVLSLVNQSLAVEWQLDAAHRGVLGSAIFVGFMVRAPACVHESDRST